MCLECFDDDCSHFNATQEWCEALETFVAISLLIFFILKLCVCVVFLEIDTQCLGQNQYVLDFDNISK